MCLIAFAWQTHPHWRLILVGNRDEFHERESEPLARWSDAPIIAGRDVIAGGTWLGVTEYGRCCGVTNVRIPTETGLGLSRGTLVKNYLETHQDTAQCVDDIERSAQDYRPFNLLLFDADQGFYVGNRPVSHALQIPAGIHGLSNADFDTPWPKTVKLTSLLHEWCEHHPSTDFAPLFDALADTQPALDEQLPDTGVGLEKERWLSPAFIVGADYGTRASTLIAIDHAGSGLIIERQFGRSGVYLGETSLQWQAA